MGKKCFVRVNVGGKQHCLSRSDITRTHFIHKRTLPPLPAFTSPARTIDSDLELENTTFLDVCFKREESSEDEWQATASAADRREDSHY